MTAATPQITAARHHRAAISPALEAGLLSVLALVVYWITGPAAAGDMWPPLAEALLSGQLHLAQDRPWLELVPRAAGGQYVPLPPVPALTLGPAALVTGPGTPWGQLDGNAYASVVGAINVGLAYWLLLGWGVAPDPRRWLTAGRTSCCWEGSRSPRCCWRPTTSPVSAPLSTSATSTSRRANPA